jgi:type VI protein secretion system component VasK
VAGDLDKPWRQSIRRVSVDRADEVADAIDSTVGSRGLGRGNVPSWARGVQVVQWLLFLAVFAGLGWAAWVQWGPKQAHHVSITIPLIVAGGAFVAGLLLALLSLAPAKRAGANAAGRLAESVRESVTQVAEREVVTPTRDEVAAHGAFHSALARVRV